MATIALGAGPNSAWTQKKSFPRRDVETKVNVLAPAGPGSLSVPAQPTPTLQSDPRVTQLYSIAKRWARDPDSSVNAGTIITFVTSLIATVQQLFTEPHTGSYKSDVLVHVLTLVLENDVDWQGDESAKQTVLALMQFAIPNIIRTAIGVARGEIDLGKMWKGCFPCCFATKAQ